MTPFFLGCNHFYFKIHVNTSHNEYIIKIETKQKQRSKLWNGSIFMILHTKKLGFVITICQSLSDWFLLRDYFGSCDVLYSSGHCQVDV